MQAGEQNSVVTDAGVNHSSVDDNVLMGPDVEAQQEGSARTDVPSANPYQNMLLAKPPPTPVQPAPPPWVAHDALSPPWPSDAKGWSAGTLAAQPPPPPHVPPGAIAAMSLMGLAALVALALGSAAAVRKFRSIDRDVIGSGIRRRAELLICVGLAVTAAGIFLRYSVDEYGSGPWFLLRQGYVAFLGALISVTGLYLLMTRPRTS